jgi:predicted transcriptional regulator YdeE
MRMNTRKGRLMAALLSGLIGLALVLTVAWSIIGWLPTKEIEMPAYTVVRETPAYEVRAYAPHIRAETAMQAGYRESLYEGFRIVADYIFGNNAGKKDIAMTAPVLTEKAGVPEKIAMTAPVLHEQEKGSGYTVAFVMPEKYTMETLPAPGNDAVRLRRIPERRYAVRTFSGYATENRAQKQITELEKALAGNGIETSGDPIVAQYNPPWTPPWMRHNEIWIAVD